MSSMDASGRVSGSGTGAGAGTAMTAAIKTAINGMKRIVTVACESAFKSERLGCCCTESTWDFLSAAEFVGDEYLVCGVGVEEDRERST